MSTCTCGRRGGNRRFSSFLSSSPVLAWLDVDLLIDLSAALLTDLSFSQRQGAVSCPRSAAGLVPEAVVVVFDQVRPLEQRVVVAGTGPRHSPQPPGHAPQAIGAGQ